MISTAMRTDLSRLLTLEARDAMLAGNQADAQYLRESAMQCAAGPAPAPKPPPAPAPRPPCCPVNPRPSLPVWGPR